MDSTTTVQHLTIDRLFDAPSLSGPTVASLKIAPDGQRITFLKGKDTDKDCLDLWEFDVSTGTAQLLVDSFGLPSQGDALSDEEQARRERQRTSALKGIVEYRYAPKGDALLFPLAGALYYCLLGAGDKHHAIQRIPTSGAVTDPSVSPLGGHIAYIVSQNLEIYDLRSGERRALTGDGGGAISNGVAEFVAQEEMDRDIGYWWAPDGQHIAFARVDESNVAETRRFEIAGDNIRTFGQRYPEAGGVNAGVTIGVVDTHTGCVTWMDLGSERDVYIARVDWLPDARALAIQRQSRDQRTLDLLFADINTGQSHVVLKETSRSWIDLNHELTFLKKRPEFIWASSRSGFTHLYLYGTDGSLIRQLTHGDWNVDNFRSRAIRGVDEDERQIFFMSTAKTPLERHLYRLAVDSGECRQITRDPGIHSVSISSCAQFYVDNYHNNARPPAVGLFDRDGNLRNWLAENKLDLSHPYAPYLASSPSTEFGTLAADDGQELHYRLFKPHDFDPLRKYPAIIDVYGGPGVQRVLNSWPGNSFSQILTRAGYVVLMLDNRGSAHRGVAFQSPILGRLGAIEVADQLCGARWLGAQRFIDHTRLGVWGWSYGGYLTLMLMFESPDTFRAGISGAPVTDWRLYDTHYTERFLGSPRDNLAGYDSSSVIDAAAKLSGDLLLVHGMADDNVLLLHSTKLMRRLQDLRKTFEIMLYPSGKHGLLRDREGRHALETMSRFFDANLMPRSLTDRN